MALRKLSRWQKASALVPMAILVGTWGAALTNTGLASASDSLGAISVPQVPSTPFDQPATVQSGSPDSMPAGIDPKAGSASAVSSLSANGIPAVALQAYHRAEALLGKADPSCKLSWTLVAAIGRVESNHGRTGGNSLSDKGNATPGIYGIPLDGSNSTALIKDSDNGALDNDPVYDRAVGPMQFIPGTWKAVAVDADGNGKKDPQNIYDAATAAGVYLCAGSDDLSTSSGAGSAVKRYNNSDSYVALVLKIAKNYAAGDFTETPNGQSASTILTSKSYDQTLTPKQRTQAKNEAKKAQQAKKEKAAKKKAAKKKQTDGSSGGTSSTGGGSSTSGGSSSGSGGLSSPTPETKVTEKTVGGTVDKVVKKAPVVKNLAPATEPVTKLLSKADASFRCGLKYSPLLAKKKYDACVYNLTH